MLIKKECRLGVTVSNISKYFMTVNPATHFQESKIWWVRRWQSNSRISYPQKFFIFGTYFFSQNIRVEFLMNSVITEGLSLELMFPPDKCFKQQRGKIQRLKSKKYLSKLLTRKFLEISKPFQPRAFLKVVLK